MLFHHTCKHKVNDINCFKICDGLRYRFIKDATHFSKWDTLKKFDPIMKYKFLINFLYVYEHTEN